MDDPTSFYIVLTPSCDLVGSGGQKPKVERVLVSRCCTTKDGINKIGWSDIGKKKLAARLPKVLLNPGYFDTILPLPAFEDRVPLMAADLRDLYLLPLDKIGRDSGDYERVASIDSPFRELVAWAYMQVGCRPGLPNRDVDAWSKQILDACGLGT